MHTNTTQRISATRALLAGAVFFGLAAASGAQADGVAGMAAGASIAVAHTTAGASAGVEQRLRDELRMVMAGLIETGAFGNQAPRQIALAVDTPAQRVNDLGLLVDSGRHDRDGVHVLGVTPGGRAEHMGLRAGDVLVALNDTTLAGDGVDATADLRRTVDALPDGSNLSFAVQRGGSAQTVSGTLASTYVPAMRLLVGQQVALAETPSTARANADGRVASAVAAQGCGRLSDFDTAPRQQQLHAARIMSIDGVTPGPTGTQAFRVAAGTHVLKVAERIENRYLAFSDRLRNAGLQSERYKTLKVDVAPDTTVLIAARLNEDKRNEPTNGAYWDPVAWKQMPEACQ